MAKESASGNNKRESDNKDEKHVPRDQIELEKMVIALQANVNSMAAAHNQGDRYANYHRGRGDTLTTSHVVYSNMTRSAHSRREIKAKCVDLISPFFC